MRVEGYILDIDGTLLSSQEAHLTAWRRALRAYGIIKSDTEIYSHFGKPTHIIVQELALNIDPIIQHQIAQLKTDYFMEAIDKIPLYPGVETTLNAIADAKIPIVFASSNYRRVLNKMYTAFGWNKISVGFIGIEDVRKSKPDPEMILKCVDKLNLSPEKCVTVGDSVYDILAGQNAGTKTIAVCTKLSVDEWEIYNPDLVVKRFGDLHPLLPLEFE